MPKVGDRVIVEGVKIGNPRREGTLIGVVGPLINVRWSDGTVSLFKPGAGSVTFAPGDGSTERKSGRANSRVSRGKPAEKRAAPKSGARGKRR